MGNKDLHERLCRYYEFITGPMPDRDRFIEVLRQTVTSDELSVFFLIPFIKPVSFEKLKSKSSKRRDWRYLYDGRIHEDRGTDLESGAPLQPPGRIIGSGRYAAGANPEGSHPYGTRNGAGEPTWRDAA